MQWRAQFDAEVTFSNGGDLSVRDFRVDLPGPTTSAEEVGEIFVRGLALTMVDRVRISALDVIAEAHKGGRDADCAPASSGRLVDLSHPIEAGMVTYPGLPGPQIVPHLTREVSRASYAPGTEFAIDSLTMLGNTGTYLDSPYHRFADGSDLAALPLERLADLPTVVVRTTGSTRRDVDAALFQPFDVAGRAVLVHTGWDAHWRSPQYGVDAPYLTADASRWLVDNGAVLVGIDSVNIDDTRDPARPAHTRLLAAGIPIVEHLTGLADLPVLGARLTATPPAVRGFGTFPVRAFAVVPRPVESDVDPLTAREGSRDG